MNDYVHIVSSNSVKIGNNVLLASKIFISDTSHGNYSGDSIIQSSPNTKPNNRPLVNKTVTIEDNVWVGEFVSILPGVTIGKGSIIGTLSVVNKSIPPYCIAAGSPARVIKKYNFETKKWQKLN
jgi:lipopolysaccharide O-acetyltransferase